MSGRRVKRPAQLPALVSPLRAPAPLMQPFGPNKAYERFNQRGHNGVDLGAVEGVAVLAAHAGTVKHAGPGADHFLMGAAAGQCVLIAAPGFLTGYAHLSRIYAVPGQDVKAGDVIGLVGMTGAATGPHLHFEVIPEPLDTANGYMGRVDPAGYLSRPATQQPG